VRHNLRIAALLLGLALVGGLGVGTARAEDRLRIDVTDPSGRKFQVAVQRFQVSEPGEQDLRDRFYAALVEAIEFSGVLQSVKPEAFLGPTETQDYENRFLPCENWTGIGADALVQGRLERIGSTLRARFRVWDTVRCRMQGKPARFEAKADSESLLARRLADEIVYRFTGRRGVSATQIAFVSDETGNKEIYVMEADGSGIRRVTGNGSINLFPSWSPEGDTLVYTSYRSGRPGLWMISRGRRRTGPFLESSRAVTYRGVWAPGNGHLALVMNEDANTDIFMVEGSGRGLRRLTFGRSIETSPSWSPDQQRLAFVSDQSGAPQIYVRDMRSGQVRRLTFEGSYNASPSWSPTGEWIAYAAQTSSNFDLYLIDPDTGYTTALVLHPRSDEDPHWSPDGRKIVFTSSRRGRKEIYTVDIADPAGSLRRLTAGKGNSSNPAWSPWLE
jgi:TolB protein